MALLALVGWVIGSAGVEHHISVETHTRCEHGAEVHVERVGTSIAVPAPTGTPSIADPTWWETEGDHHCSATAPIVVAEPELSADPVVIPASFESPVLPVSRVAVAAALFRLAPKTSPPIGLV